MQSKNFEYLRPTFNDLADLGAFAERIVHLVYHPHGLPMPHQPVTTLRKVSDQREQGRWAREKLLNALVQRTFRGEL